MSKQLVIFTYAPAGLGHIRVTDALKDSLPKDYDSLIFAPTDPSIEYIHRITSLNLVARRIMEWIQHGIPQKIFTRFYRNFLKKHTENIFLEFTSLIKSLPSTPQKIIIVSTHFGLAYQIGVLKTKLEKELKTKISLVVQVTDDSPQYIWYVDVADSIIVPSQNTADELQKYGRREKLKTVNFSVVPYPINSSLAKILTINQINQRLEQYNPKSEIPINIIIPISGAAVGMGFFIHLTQKLHQLSNRFIFHIVCRQTFFTQNFIVNMKSKKYINLYTSDNYQNIVDLYDNIYKNNIIAAEITKPSEQLFKALLRNDSVGGSFLFFAHPVGRQEYDNLDFLNKSNLLSSVGRGVLLPSGSTNSARFINQFFTNGVLYNNFPLLQKTQPKQIDNVAIFWQEIKKSFQ